MSDSQGSPLSYPRIERYRWALLVAWTGIILGLLVVDYWQLHNGIERIALTEARAYFMKDQAFRQWSTLHGGVYVPSTEATPPNPYLAHIPERDIETPSGKRLTLMNPAYVVRQMNDQFANLYGIVGHITSLKPLRPENSPDEWERQALEAFHLGEKEIREFTEIQDVPYLRLMKPMITQKGCLKCHSHQGYQVGDVRGGVSVSLPMASLLAHRNEGTFWHGMVSLVLWILGCLGIVLGSRRIQAQTREQERVEETQRESEARHRALVEMLPDGVCLLDGDRRVVLANPQGRAQLDTLAVRAADGSLTHLGGYLAEEMLESMEGVHEIAVQSGQQTFELRFQKIGEDGSGWAMVMQDVTQDLLIQEQLQQQERLAAVGQLAAGIAHDFNNILSVIMSSAQVIEISEEMSLQSREDLREISSQAKQAAQLIQQILDFSRQTSAEKQVVDLADFVKEAVKLLLRTLPEHIRVTTHIESGDLQIKANRRPSQFLFRAGC